LQQVNISKRYGIEEVVLTRIGGQSNPLREAGVLQIYVGEGKGKKILCYKCDEDVSNTDRILLSSLRTIRNANIDIPHHMDKLLDGISSPLLFLHDKDARRSRRKKGTFSRARASAHVRRKFNRGNSCTISSASFQHSGSEGIRGRKVP
jgi:hypothetical protein